MQIENPPLHEHENPNRPQQPLHRELSTLFGYGALLLLGIFGLARGTAWLVGHYLPYAYEQRYLEPVVQQMWADTHEDAALQHLADQLAAQMPLPAGMKVHIHVSPDEDVNAFATFGGHIVVMRGLLETAPSEQSLSMVLAHEMAHLQHRDSLKAASQGAFLQLARAAIFGKQAIMGNTLMLGALSYSRTQETAADERALDTLAAHYGHVNGAMQMYQTLAQTEDTPRAHGLPNWLATHPDTMQRMAHLQQYAQQHHYAADGALTPNPWFKTPSPKQQ